MKALVINSSYRTHGNTDGLCNIVVQKLKKNDIEVSRINLSERTINQCRGCRLCFDKGEKYCPNKDDVLLLYSKMKTADLIIWASPVYVEDINGLLKIFIDRLAFNCHRPSLFNQSCFVYINSGGGASNHSIKTIERANQSWGARLIGNRKLTLGAHTEELEIEKRYGKRIDQDIHEILQKTRKVRSPSFIQVLTFHIQKWYYQNKVDKNSYDYQYWKTSGWLNPNASYYTSKTVSPIKKSVAKTVALMIAKFILT